MPPKRRRAGCAFGRCVGVHLPDVILARAWSPLVVQIAGPWRVVATPIRRAARPGKLGIVPLTLTKAPSGRQKIDFVRAERIGARRGGHAREARMPSRC
jgi:hypothetical protein